MQERPRWDLNPQSLPPEGSALSILGESCEKTATQGHLDFQPGREKKIDFFETKKIFYDILEI